VHGLAVDNLIQNSRHVLEKARRSVEETRQLTERSRILVTESLARLRRLPRVLVCIEELDNAEAALTDAWASEPDARPGTDNQPHD